MSQISFFDGRQKLMIDKPVRLIECFAGIGAQAKALENLGVPFEHYRICEFDKYAVKSYNAIHGTNFEVSDITKIHAEDLGVVDTDNYCYILTYSFPCQDLSTAGKQRGMRRNSGTRSGLLWEVERLLCEMKELPQILLMENVPNVVSDKNIADFAEWIAFLDSLGYRSKYEILNAKNYGIPQNRERCFMVSWLGDYYYDFPAGFPLKRRLKDVLEDKVDEKYYLSDKQVNALLNSTYTATAKSSMEKIEPIEVGSIAGLKGYNEMNGRIYSPDGASPTIRANSGGHNEVKIAEQQKNIIIYDDYNGKIKSDQSIIGTVMPNFGNDAIRNGTKIIELQEPKALRIEPKIAAIRGRNPENPSDRTAGIETQQRLEIGGYCSNALTTVQKDNVVIEPSIRVRKLTPKECFRLMGFDDESFESAEQVNSNSQLYKQAGNSICVPVLEKIFGELFS